MPDDPNVAVLASSTFVSITVEDGTEPDADEVHLHAGGQGVWVARMLRHLGEAPVLCAPLGGESGWALRGLAREWDLDLEVVVTASASPAYVHDRRDGDRTEVARSPVPALNRHEVDELYGRALECALAAGVAVVTGRFSPDEVPADVHRRWGADLADAGVRVVGDLHGEELDAYLDEGVLAWLKVSQDDLVEDGRLDADADEAAAVAAIRELAPRRAEAIILSRSDDPALALADGTIHRLHAPSLEVVDTSGSGDAMTAALAAALVRDLPSEDTLRLAMAAGVANVVRHGLGSANPGLIDTVAERVTIEPLEDA